MNADTIARAFKSAMDSFLKCLSQAAQITREINYDSFLLTP